MKKQFFKTKKEGLPKKLDPAWVAYLIDITAGHRLMMIVMRFPERADKLNQILITAINKMFKENRNTFMADPVQFVHSARMVVQELTDNFITVNLKDTLVNGMPAPVVSNQPGGFNPKIIQ